MSKHKYRVSEEQLIETENQLAIEPEITPEPEIAPAPIPLKKGMVVDCARLNVRKKPKADAEVVVIIDRWANVLIDEENSTKSFYKVCTEAGVEGYCMKQYIRIFN